MTLLITGLAAVVVGGLRFGLPRAPARWRLGLLTLIYLGACLMWCVDGLASVARGGPFLELTDKAVVRRETWQGLCVLSLGLVAWSVVGAVGRVRGQTDKPG